MDYEKLEEYISKPRLDRYLVSCGYSKDRAVKLYEANIMVAQAFYPVLNLFETFLRNSINDKLTIHFGDEAWIINQKTKFMSHATLAPKFGMRKQVIKAETNIRGPKTPGKIISEQTFGFWASLFENRHYRLISGQVIKCFPKKPIKYNRPEITNRLEAIRKFRNRVYHNENICFNNDVIDFSNATMIKNEIYNLLEWMDADIKDYVKKFDEIDAKIAHALTV